MATREEDYVETVFTASTHDNILFFTSLGRVYQRKGYQIPEAGRAARGTNIVNILPTESGRARRLPAARARGREVPLHVHCQRHGEAHEPRGHTHIRKTGIRAISIDEGDELISAVLTDGQRNMLLATSDGYAICFDENDARPMGRDAVGVRGIKLREGDRVVAAIPAIDGAGCSLSPRTATASARR